MELDENMLTQFGMMNKLSSGNMIFDVALCLMLPALLAHVSQYTQKIKEFIKRLLLPGGGGYTREIEYVTVNGYHWYDEDNSRNKILQVAIFRYLDANPCIAEKLKWAKFQLVKDPELLKELSDADETGSKCGSDSDSHYDSDCDDRSRDILSYKAQVVPPENWKFEVEEGIYFLMSTRQDNVGDKKSKSVRSIILSSDATNARKLIDEFVDKALDLYKSVEGSKKDDSRYLYTPLLSRSLNSADATEKSTLMFKRYELSDEKTFDSFFHPEKEALLHLLDNFLNKKGKYSVPGYPHKLGLLLHGPPGTGKTSLVKALANHTKRHIISVPLSRVKTNQDLMDLVLDQAAKVEGNDWTYKLPFRKTIFVMEDVDAAADVVHKRGESDLLVPISTVAIDDSDDSSSTGDAAGTVGASDKRRSKEEYAKLLKHSKENRFSKFWAVDDELNLAGILNVLDGVIDCPNRMVVMTTNHPEKLDPALVRPGRINKTLYLGLLRREEASFMIERYYGDLGTEDRLELARIFPHEKISPAALECLCAECDTVGDFFEGLNKLISKLS